MKYTFIREGIPEEVKDEPWKWEAFYLDETSLKQFGDDGIFHQFQEIDQSKLKRFVMYNSENGLQHSLIFNPDTMKLLHFYRRVRDLNTNELLGTMYIFGFEKDVNGKLVSHFIYITPTNELVITDDKELVRF